MTAPLSFGGEVWPKIALLAPDPFQENLGENGGDLAALSRYIMDALAHVHIRPGATAR